MQAEKAEADTFMVRLRSNRAIPVCNFYVSPEKIASFDWYQLGDDKTFLFGDCNVRGHWDFANESTQSAALEKYLLETRHLVLNDGSPTFMRQNYTSAIDITAVPAENVLECSWKTLHPVFSDHLPILTTIDCHTGIVRKHGRARWNISLADWDGYKGHLELLIKDKLPLSQWKSLTVDQLNKKLKNFIWQAAKLHIPRGRLNGKPWWTSEVVEATEERRRAFEAYCQNPTTEALQALLTVKTSTEETIMAAKRQCWQAKAGSIKNDREGFRLLRNLQGTMRAKATIISNCAKSAHCK